jgi:hypothetical protein
MTCGFKKNDIPINEYFHLYLSRVIVIPILTKLLIRRKIVKLFGR